MATETGAALDVLEEIAAVDGVDGVFIGPSDLSASHGHVGEPWHPEMLAVHEDAFRRIQAAGKAVGILTLEEDRARRHVEMGATFIAVGVLRLPMIPVVLVLAPVGIGLAWREGCAGGG